MSTSFSRSRMLPAGRSRAGSGTCPERRARPSRYGASPTTSRLPARDRCSIGCWSRSLRRHAGPSSRSLLALIDYFDPSDSGAVQALLDQGPLQAANAAVAVYELEAFDGIELFKFPHDLAARDDNRLRLMAASAGWSTLGPADQPANPALSWEYWNGSSWWALDAGTFADRTANLLLTGGVFFTVPADVRGTEVGGR